MHLDGVENFPCLKNKKSNNYNQKLNKILFLLFIFFSIIVLFFLAYFFIFKGRTVSKDKSAQLKIDLPERIVVGKETTFFISVFNQEQSALLDAELFINFPTDFKLIMTEPACSKVSSAGCFIDFPKIENNVVRDIKITGKFFNLADEEIKLNARLSFQLANFSSWFKKEVSEKIIFDNLNVDLAIEGPSELMIAEEENFRLRISNNEEESISLVIVLFSPETFNITNFSSFYYDKKDGKIIWQLDLGRYEEKTIDFSGYFKEENDLNEIVAQIGFINEDNNFFSQVEKKYLVKIGGPGLVLGLKANNLFDENINNNLGDSILLDLSYKNIGQEKIFDQIFNIIINPAEIIKLEKNDTWSWLVNDDDIIAESFKIETRDDYQVISFSSPKVKEIDPGQEGEIKINFGIKNKEDLSTEQLANPIIFLKAEALAKIFKRQMMIFKVESNEIKINFQ